MKPYTVFVSGHLDLTEEEFQTHYHRAIFSYLIAGPKYHFIVGDARGADTMFQQLAKDWNLDDVVTVCHMFDKPRNHLCGKLIGGFQSDEERDQFMTLHSDLDLAWVRPGRENSGTAKNLRRRNVN